MRRASMLPAMEEACTKDYENVQVFREESVSLEAREIYSLEEDHT